VASTLVVALSDKKLSDRNTNDCLSFPHLAVAAYVALVYLFIGWFSKRWLVQKEQAGAEIGCRAAENVSYWEVPGLVQSKIGGVALAIMQVICFGRDWYEACTGGGGG
jgi:hypothetical protein